MIEAELRDATLTVEDIGAGAALLQAEQRLEQRAGSQIERQRAAPARAASRSDRATMPAGALPPRRGDAPLPARHRSL